MNEFLFYYLIGYFVFVIPHVIAFKVGSRKNFPRSYESMKEFDIFIGCMVCWLWPISVPIWLINYVSDGFADAIIKDKK